VVNESASPKFAVGERVLVPSAQRATTVSEVVSQGGSFGYRLAGLGQALIAETDIEGIVIDGRQKRKITPPA
jgi:hypothetical protein